MNTPFDNLIREFPVYQVKNKAPVSKNILLKNNEELVVPAQAVVKIDSTLLTNIPASTYFKSISPSIKDLIRLGLITSKTETVEPAKTPEPVEPLEPVKVKAEDKQDGKKK